MTRRILGALADSGPVVVLAGIAAAGSFTHIRDTATEHGQHGWMAWAIAVCIDLTCVMAAGERQRDKHTGRDTARLSWPTVVLVGGVLLSLAANLAQADPSVWGWITAGTPAGAFLVAVSMLERRKAGPRAAARPSPRPGADVLPVPDSFGNPSPSGSPDSSAASSSPSSPWVVWERPPAAAAAAAASVQDDQERGEDEQDGQTSIPVPADHPASTPSASPPSPSPAAPLVDFARRVAAEHESEHGRPITRDALRARLGVSNQLASDLLRQLRTEHNGAEAAPVA
ncbi:DUF2637 domain-containing protein [Spirillospora sp. NPDC048823]|uniref:DUF2637 domain-containing protein n=1 Tax=unclassified Spirillospora TaxID=2642701 RepID=UPI0037128214